MDALSWFDQAVDDTEVVDRGEHGGCEEFPCTGEAAANDDHREVERVDEVGDADSEIETYTIEYEFRRRVSLFCKFGDVQGYGAAR